MATYMKLTSDAWRKLKPIATEVSTISFCVNIRNAARRQFGTICENSSFDRHAMAAGGVKRIGQVVTAAGHNRSTIIVDAHFPFRGSSSHQCLVPRRLAGSSARNTAEGRTIVKTILHGVELRGRLLENRTVLRHLLQARTFSSASRGGEDNLGNGSGASGIDESGSGDDSSSSSSNAEFVQPLTALSPMTVPEVWPRVPVIAVRRNPLFPRFVKMIEASSSSCRLT